MTRAVGVLGVLLGLMCSTAATAQPPAASRIVGSQIGAHMEIDPKAGVMTDTATLRFESPDHQSVYTIEFIARHAVQQPVASPGVVDIVVTEHPAEDDAPAMALRVDGDAVPVVTRLRSQRSVVATVSLADFDRIAHAGAVVDRTFNIELELGPGQAGMLRTIADRWLGSVR